MIKKKQHIVIKQDENLKGIDDELDSALQILDGANQRVSELLIEEANSGPNAGAVEGETLPSAPAEH